MQEFFPFAKRASSVKHSGKVVRTITRSEIAELNKAIEPKIRQNERERTARRMQRLGCIVGVTTDLQKLER